MLALHPLLLASLAVLPAPHLGWVAVLHLDAAIGVLAALTLTRRMTPRPAPKPRPPSPPSGWNDALDGFSAHLVVPTSFPEDRASARAIPLNVSAATVVVLTYLIGPLAFVDEAPPMSLLTPAMVGLVYALAMHTLADWDWTRPRAFVGHHTQVVLKGRVLRVNDTPVVLGSRPELQLDPVYDVLHVTGDQGQRLRIPGDPEELVWLQRQLRRATQSRKTAHAGKVPEALEHLRH